MLHSAHCDKQTTSNGALPQERSCSKVQFSQYVDGVRFLLKVRATRTDSAASKRAQNTWSKISGRVSSTTALILPLPSIPFLLCCWGVGRTSGNRSHGGARTSRTRRSSRNRPRGRASRKQLGTRLRSSAPYATRSRWGSSRYCAKGLAAPRLRCAQAPCTRTPSSASGSRKKVQCTSKANAHRKSRSPLLRNALRT